MGREKLDAVNNKIMSDERIHDLKQTTNINGDIKNNAFGKFIPKGTSFFRMDRSAFVSFCMADMYTRGSKDGQDLIYRLTDPDLYAEENAETAKYINDLMAAAQSDANSPSKDNIDKFFDTMKKGMNAMIQEWNTLYVDYRAHLEDPLFYNTFAGRKFNLLSEAIFDIGQEFQIFKGIYGSNVKLPDDVNELVKYANFCGAVVQNIGSIAKLPEGENLPGFSIPKALQTYVVDRIASRLAMQSLDARLGVLPNGTRTEKTEMEKFSDIEVGNLLQVPLTAQMEFLEGPCTTVVNALQNINFSETKYHGDIKTWLRDRIADGSIEDLIKIELHGSNKDSNPKYDIIIENDFVNSPQKFVDNWMVNNGYKAKTETETKSTFSQMFSGWFGSKPVESAKPAEPAESSHELSDMIKQDKVAYSKFDTERSGFLRDRLKAKDDAEKEEKRRLDEINSKKANLKKVETRDDSAAVLKHAQDEYKKEKAVEKLSEIANKKSKENAFGKIKEEAKAVEEKEKAKKEAIEKLSQIANKKSKENAFGKIKEKAEANMKNFKDVLAKLEDIRDRTTWNSSEYKELVTALKNYTINREEHDVNELQKINDRIDRYMTHKANDGVNKKSYGKLIQIDKLSYLVCNAMNVVRGEKTESHWYHKEHYEGVTGWIPENYAGNAKEIDDLGFLPGKEDERLDNSFRKLVAIADVNHSSKKDGLTNQLLNHQNKELRSIKASSKNLKDSIDNELGKDSDMSKTMNGIITVIDNQMTGTGKADMTKVRNEVSKAMKTIDEKVLDQGKLLNAKETFNKLAKSCGYKVKTGKPEAIEKDAPIEHKVLSK